MTTSATNLGHQPGACITSVVPRSCLIGRAKGRQAVQRLYVLKSDLAALRRSLVCNTHVVSKVLSMACPLQMVSLIHGLTLKRQAALAVHMGDSTICCKCATANRVLVVSAISL